MLALDDIRIYPVKGLRGFSVTEAEVEPWGLKDDRRWMVVGPSGQFITQRQVPRMAVIAADLVPGGLRFSAEGYGVCEAAVPGPDAETLDVIIWKDRVEARSASRDVEDWLTRVLGVPCRLVHMADPANARPADPDYAETTDRVSFADGFPLLVTTLASLDDLNRRLPSPVGMGRFRPNVVIRGAGAWDEDSWNRLLIGSASFAGVKDCARCVVTTIDQDTGAKAGDGEPLRTLAAFRRKGGGRVIFGQNLVPRMLGSIHVGDIVEVPGQGGWPPPTLLGGGGPSYTNGH